MAVFEIGCGAGFYPEALAEEAGTWLALEPNLEMFAACNPMNYRVLSSTFADFRKSAADTRYDRILIAGVLEFCETADEARAMCEWAVQRLTPSGRLVLLVPSSNWRGSFYLQWHHHFDCPTLSKLSLSETLKSLGPIQRVAAGPFSDVVVKVFQE